MTDLEALETRIAELETQAASRARTLDALDTMIAQARTRQAQSTALTPGQRLALYQARTAATSPDSLRYPNDYQDPADSPAAFGTLAADVQAALNRRTGIIRHSPVDFGASGAGHEWESYRHITTVLPTWYGIGAWLELASQAQAGTWEVWGHCYIDATGGPSSPVAVFTGIKSTWHDGTATDTGEGHVLVGRLTAPANTRIVTSAVAMIRIVNIPGKLLRVRPAAQIGATVTGAAPLVGINRISATFIPNAATAPITGHGPAASPWEGFDGHH